MATSTENPYPLHFLTNEQLPVYLEWKMLFDLTHNPPPENTQIATIMMPTGDWLDRVSTALDILRERFVSQEMKQHLVISGKHSHPELSDGGMGADRIVRDIKESNFVDEIKHSLISEPNSTNTKEQVDNIYSLLKSGIIQEPLIVVVSAYHLPRLYATFIKTLLSREDPLRTHLYSVAVELPWTGTIPHEPRGKRWEQVFSEMGRIGHYRQSGDVATQQEVLKYRHWLINS